jgi:nicotinic acid mononucleotide adenylyltransferase
MDPKNKLTYNQLNYFTPTPLSQSAAVPATSTSPVDYQQKSPNLLIAVDSPFPVNNNQPSNGRINNQTGSHSAGGLMSSSSNTTSNSTMRPAVMKLPAHTEIYSSSPNATGLPILEIIKRLEEENIINRTDRLLLKDCIYSDNNQKRNDVIKALCDIELNSSKFSIRRLKSLLYENGSGEVSSKNMNTTNNSNNIPQPVNLFKQDSKHAKVGQLALISNDTNYNGNKNNHDHSNSHSNSNNNNNKRIYVSQHVNGVASNDEINHNNNNNNSNLTTNNPSPVNTSRSAAGKFFNPVKMNSSRLSNVNPNTIVDSAEAPNSNQSSYPPTQRNQNNNNNNNKNEYELSPSSQHSPTNISINNNNNNNDSKVKAIQSARTSSDKVKQPPQQQLHQQLLPSPQQSDKSPPLDHKKIHRNQKKDPFEEDDEEFETWNVQDNVNKIVGESTDYSGQQNNANILHKIIKRFDDLKQKVNLPKVLSMQNRKLAVLVGSGSFNPLTRMHLRSYFLAKQYLESKLGYIILGSLLSPSHTVTVRERYRNNPLEIIPSPHRLAVAQLLVSNSQWLSIDPWEITRRRAMDYLSLLEHISTILRETFPLFEIHLVYLCKSNLVTTLSPQALKDLQCHVVSVCRSPESEYLRSNLSSKWNGIVHIVEDSAILDASLDVVTSRKVRDKIKNNESVEQLVGGKINEYVNFHRFGPKVRFVHLNPIIILLFNICFLCSQIS